MLISRLAHTEREKKSLAERLPLFLANASMSSERENEKKKKKKEGEKEFILVQVRSTCVCLCEEKWILIYQIVFYVATFITQIHTPTRMQWIQMKVKNSIEDQINLSSREEKEEMREREECHSLWLSPWLSITHFSVYFRFHSNSVYVLYCNFSFAENNHVPIVIEDLLYFFCLSLFSRSHTHINFFVLLPRKKTEEKSQKVKASLQ